MTPILRGLNHAPWSRAYSVHFTVRAVAATLRKLHAERAADMETRDAT